MATRMTSYGNFSQWENICPVAPEEALQKCNYNIFSEVEDTQPKFNQFSLPRSEQLLEHHRYPKHNHNLRLTPPLGMDGIALFWRGCSRHILISEPLSCPARYFLLQYLKDCLFHNNFIPFPSKY